MRKAELVREVVERVESLASSLNVKQLRELLERHGGVARACEVKPSVVPGAGKRKVAPKKRGSK